MDSLCSNQTLSKTCYAARAGTYNRNQSTSAFSLDPSPWKTCYWNVQGECIASVVGDQVTLGTVIPNISFTAIHQTYQTYPNGREFPISVGNLALGASRLKHNVSGLALNMIAAWLYTSAREDERIPSYSYGMHIGSVNPAIAGSLILGGYDKSRVLGEVSAQPVSQDSDFSGILQIVLKDIGIGVAAGESPFSFASKDGLFIQPSGLVLPKSVTIDPTKPYMYLPEATCDAITASLPVSFNRSLGLYFWDTGSSEYKNITSSAIYLSFRFNKDSLNNRHITVKVSFALLALTLQDPLVEQNVTYFPCFFSTDTPVLGRAFLQAAFVGVNWFEGNGTGTWFMAQAPGPGHPGADITTINANDTALGASNSSWEPSWASHWHPLEKYGSNGSTSSTGGLSTGAKAGIGVGAGVGGVIFIGVGIWAVMHRRNRQEGAIDTRKAVFQVVSELLGRKKDGRPKELDGGDTAQPREMIADTVQPREMMATQEPQRYELH